MLTAFQISDFLENPSLKFLKLQKHHFKAFPRRGLQCVATLFILIYLVLQLAAGVRSLLPMMVCLQVTTLRLTAALH